MYKNKEKYVVHISALKQALNKVLILKKVHRVIQFDQEAWLKPYININSELRKEAKNDLQKELFKLMNSSVLGKTMENVRNHREYQNSTTNNKEILLILLINKEINQCQNQIIIQPNAFQKIC